MSAPEVGMDLVEAIKSDKYDVIIINFANLIWLDIQVLSQQQSRL